MTETGIVNIDYAAAMTLKAHWTYVEGKYRFGPSEFNELSEAQKEVFRDNVRVAVAAEQKYGEYDDNEELIAGALYASEHKSGGPSWAALHEQEREYYRSLAFTACSAAKETNIGNFEYEGVAGK